VLYEHTRFFSRHKESTSVKKCQTGWFDSDCGRRKATSGLRLLPEFNFSGSDGMKARLLMVCLAGAASWGATIIDRGGSFGGGWGGLGLFFPSAVGFSLASEYTNVSIDVPFFTNSLGVGNLTVYLTTQLGAGTTAASHEIWNSTAPLVLPGSIPQYQTILTGLTLGPGDFYLTLAGSGVAVDALWISSTSPNLTTTTSGGAVLTDSLLYAAPPGTYLPASTFLQQDPYSFWFRVTGDAVESVPEPGTAVFAIPGFVLIWLLRRRLEE